MIKVVFFDVPVLLVEKERMYINFVNKKVEKAQREISSDVPDTGEYGGGEIYQAIAYVEKEKEGELKSILPDCRITR